VSNTSWQEKKDMSRTLFAEEFRLAKISEKDPLVRIKAITNWSIFEKELDKIFPARTYEKGGRPSYSKLLLFKIVFLQEYYGLSDEGIEYQINDRLSFMRFLDLTMDHHVPDRNTIWNFKEALKQTGAAQRLFDVFVKELSKKGLLVKKGSMIDASIVNAPVQRNTRDENEQIKNGETPDWDEKKAAHKDTDARWTEKHGKQYFGYKNHIKADSKSKLITACQVTPANIHDCEALLHLLSTEDMGKPLYADSAYKSEATETVLAALQIKSKIQHKAYRNKPLKKWQQTFNKKVSKVRCRIEHIFGHMHQRTGQVRIRCIGIARASRNILLKNIAYNIQRSAYLIG